MKKFYDVVIVGGSLAGASAAIRLGQSGLKVALIDKASFPRRKPCGEGLTSFGLAQLDILGVKNSILELPHLQYHGYRIKAGRSSSIIRSPWNGNITIQRTLLDAELLRKALEFPNITPFLSQHVVKVAPYRVELEAASLSAKHIILACGGASPLLKKLPCQIKKLGPSRAGISITLQGEFLKQLKYIKIILKKDFEIYCTPLALGRLNISILKHTDCPLNLRSLILSPDVLNEVFEECSFKGEIELPPEGRTNIGNVRRSCAIPSICLAGDAKEEFDPIGGMGMSHAFSSGIQAADAILNTFFINRKVPAVKSSKSSIDTMRIFTSLTYRTLMSAKHFPALLPLAACALSHNLLKFLTRELS